MIRNKAGVLAACCALFVTACGESNPDAAQPSQDDAKQGAEPFAQDFRLEPGKYRTTVSIDSLDMPGLPPQVAQQTRAMMADAASAESCVTSRDAARGIEVIKRQVARGDCEFQKFETHGDTVEAAFQCRTGDGMTMVATSRGTYSSTGSKVSLTGDLAGPNGKAMHIEQTVTTERIGDCS